MDIDTSQNTSFSQATPGLQLAMDSTSLGAAKTCLRKYYYSIILGWQPKSTSIHLTYGLLVHGCAEQYHHAKAEGFLHGEALDKALDWVLRKTWNAELKRPWLTDDPNKNRLTLIRTMVWYLDQFENDPMGTIILPNGKPGVELSFRFDSGFKTREGEAFILCGHLDRIAEMNGVPYILDVKTTKHTIDARWFKQFTPHNQFSLYTLAGRVAFGVQIKSLIVDGIQVAVNFSRLARAPIPRDDAMVEEFLEGTGEWLHVIEEAAIRQQWPMNESSCDKFGGCEFRDVCSRSPRAREQWLGVDYKKRVWDPLQRRGDI